MEDQFSTLGQSLKEFSDRGGEGVEDIIREITGGTLNYNTADESSSQKEVDDLIRKITGEGEKGT